MPLVVEIAQRYNYIDLIIYQKELVTHQITEMAVPPAAKISRVVMLPPRVMVQAVAVAVVTLMSINLAE